MVSILKTPLVPNITLQLLLLRLISYILNVAFTHNTNDIIWAIFLYADSQAPIESVIASRGPTPSQMTSFE